MKARVKMVDKLENVGKTYTIYVKNNKFTNLTIEEGHELDAETALNIVKYIARLNDMNPDNIKPEDVTFEEAEPELD